MFTRTQDKPLSLRSSLPGPNVTEPTPSLTALGPHFPFPQENDIVMTLHQLNEAGEGLANEVLLE